MVTFVTLLSIFATAGAAGYIFWNDEKILKYIYNYFGDDYNNHTWIYDFIIMFIITSLICIFGILLNLGLIILLPV